MGLSTGKLSDSGNANDCQVEKPHEKRQRPYETFSSTSLYDDSHHSSKRKAIPDEGPPEKKRRILDSLAMLKDKYKQQKKIGEGGCGSVFAGFRKMDNLPVAIKHIPKDPMHLMHEDDDGERIPMEVAIMQKLGAESEPLSAPVRLLDWYDMDQKVILVMERPMPAVDLRKYISDKGGRLKEKEAKIIMRQVVEAAIDLKKKHIFHRDIKVENILIETSMHRPRVRIIDFGFSRFDDEGDAYHIFFGTHPPPEWFAWEEYEAEPSTVWQIGTVLFDMLQNPTFGSDLSQLHEKITKVSKNCKDFFKMCFLKHPDNRSTLEELRAHEWLR